MSRRTSEAAVVLLQGAKPVFQPTHADLFDASVFEAIHVLWEYWMQQAGGVRSPNARFLDPLITFSPPSLPAGTSVVVLFDGAFESRDIPGTPGEFFGLVEDSSVLNGVEFIRIHFFMFSSTVSLAVPGVSEVQLDIDFDDP